MGLFDFLFGPRYNCSLCKDTGVYDANEGDPDAYGEDWRLCSCKAAIPDKDASDESTKEEN